MAILDEQLEMLPKGSLIKIIKEINKDYDKFSSNIIVEEIRIHNRIHKAKLSVLILNELKAEARKEEQWVNLMFMRTQQRKPGTKM